MEGSRWQDLGSILVNALELAPGERSDFLDEVCAGDATLRAEAESLLAAYQQAPGFFASLGEGVQAPMQALGAGPASAALQDPHQLVGQEIGQYRVLDYLGGGGMGVVYKAEDTRLQRTVALKFLPPVLSRDAQARQRFLQEARAASALDHSNICTVYEVNETKQGQFFISMAFYDGETLRHRIDRGPLPIDTALDVARQMADGLSAAHAHGIVHRDVKPANVIIRSDGRVKILDFGLAKLAGSAQLTQTGATLGTVSYMAPEQARGETVDHRVDVWALGVVLYEMIAGQRPFPGDYPQAVLYGILNLEPKPVTGLREGVPLQLAHLVNKTLAKGVAKRYQQMADLLADLNVIHQRNAARSTARRAVMAPAVDTVPEAPQAPVDASPGEGPIHILVVDDEPELELLVRQKFRRFIRDNAWAFHFATDGREALEILAAEPAISLVLTDLNMPGMDGLTLLSRLQELDRTVKAVVVSAYGDMANIRTAMNRGAFDFVTKPIDFKDLEATIEKTRLDLMAYLKASEAQRQLVAMRKELEVARRIQEAILPLSFPKRRDIELYAFTTTAREVGGTFYDYLTVGDDRVGFLMGDVAGKGVSAALFMAMSQTFLKGIALQGEAPGACLSAMNRLLFPEGFPDLHVTVFYGLLNTRTGELAYTNAGHPAPYVLRAGSVVAPLDGRDVPVWRDRNDMFETRRLSLVPGDSLFLFTQGVTEARDAAGHAYSAERLAAHLREEHDSAPAQLIRAVVRAVMHHTDDAPLTDDLTVMAVRYLDR